MSLEGRVIQKSGAQVIKNSAAKVVLNVAHKILVILDVMEQISLEMYNSQSN